MFVTSCGGISVRRTKPADSVHLAEETDDVASAMARIVNGDLRCDRENVIAGSSRVEYWNEQNEANKSFWKALTPKDSKLVGWRPKQKTLTN